MTNKARATGDPSGGREVDRFPRGYALGSPYVGDVVGTARCGGTGRF
jgi:hypothetical protein